jgi:hypothetical protein
LTPRRFSVFPLCGPATFLSPRPEKSQNREGKQSVKFIDGLANLAALHAGSAFGRVSDAVYFESESSFPRSIVIKMSALWTLSTLHSG